MSVPRWLLGGRMRRLLRWLNGPGTIRLPRWLLAAIVAPVIGRGIAHLIAQSWADRALDAAVILLGLWYLERWGKRHDA